MGVVNRVGDRGLAFARSDAPGELGRGKVEGGLALVESLFKDESSTSISSGWSPRYHLVKYNAERRFVRSQT